MPPMTKYDMVQIDPGQCVACAICVDVCPQAALRLESDALLPVLQPDRCNGCGVCERECPTAAAIVDGAQAKTTR